MEYDPSDEESVETEAAFARARDHQRREAWDGIMRDPRGRIVLAEILLSSGFFAQSYTPGQPDQTIFNEGRRSVGLNLHNQLNLIGPELLPDIEARMREMVRDVGVSSRASD